MTYGPAIHAALRTACNVTCLYVTYPSNVMTIAAMTGEAPKSILIFQEESGFERSARNRMDPRLPRERVTSTWVVDMAFDKEVSLEALEEALMASPPRIARGAASGVTQQVTLELLGASYVHPVRGQPAQGTRARFRFNANHKRV